MTITNVCNLALSKMGLPNITSLEDGTKQADSCALFFNPTILEVFSDDEYDFAKRRLILELSTEDNLTEWDYMYILSNRSEIIAITKLLYRPSSTVNKWSQSSEQYQIIGNYLYCNISPAGIEYLAIVDDPDQWPADFMLAVVARLEYNLTMPLLGDLQRQQMALQAYAQMSSKYSLKQGAERFQEELGGQKWDEVN